jgi:hypothetical protein
MLPDLDGAATAQVMQRNLGLNHRLADPCAVLAWTRRLGTGAHLLLEGVGCVADAGAAATGATVGREPNAWFKRPPENRLLAAEPREDAPA